MKVISPLVPQLFFLVLLRVDPPRSKTGKTTPTRPTNLVLSAEDGHLRPAVNLKIFLHVGKRFYKIAENLALAFHGIRRIWPRITHSTSNSAVGIGAAYLSDMTQITYPCEAG